MFNTFFLLVYCHFYLFIILAVSFACSLSDQKAHKSWTKLRDLIIAAKDEDIATEDTSSSSADDENSEESKTERIRSNLGGRPFRTGMNRKHTTSQDSSSLRLKASVSKIWNTSVKFDRMCVVLGVAPHNFCRKGFSFTFSKRSEEIDSRKREI